MFYREKDGILAKIKALTADFEQRSQNDASVLKAIADGLVPVTKTVSESVKPVGGLSKPVPVNHKHGNTITVKAEIHPPPPAWDLIEEIDTVCDGDIMDVGTCDTDVKSVKPVKRKISFATSTPTKSMFFFLLYLHI